MSENPSRAVRIVVCLRNAILGLIVSPIHFGLRLGFSATTTIRSLGEPGFPDML